jgi:hypothetical protein
MTQSRIYQEKNQEEILDNINVFCIFAFTQEQLSNYMLFQKLKLIKMEIFAFIKYNRICS